MACEISTDVDSEQRSLIPKTKITFDFHQWAKDSNLSETTVRKLIDEECTGHLALMNITEENVKELGFKFGARVELFAALKNLKKHNEEGKESGGIATEKEETSNVDQEAFQVDFRRQAKLLTPRKGEADSLGASKVDFRKQAKLLTPKKGEADGLGVYHLQPNLVFNSEKCKGKKGHQIRKYELGPANDEKAHKVIMLLGATGSGKTTLINAIVNYLFGLKWGDNYRYKLIHENEEANQGNQAKSQTTWISSYTLHHQEGFQTPYSLTLIDTPGFGDTGGLKRDEFITEQIKTFFTTKGDEGIDRIDAVGFVIQSSFPRLTPTQHYVFDQVFGLFGKDIEENIFLMLTFADGKEPQVLSGVKEAELSYEQFFKFNNSSLFTYRGASDSDEFCFDEMFWKMGTVSFEKFFSQLSVAKPKSLLMTRDVLDERERLTLSIEGIQLQIRLGLNKLEDLKKETEIVKKYDFEMLQTSKHTYTVNEEKVEKVPIPQGTYITNCIKCNRTCHQRCQIPRDEDKHGCWAMDQSGNCHQCVKRCHWSDHGNFPYEYVFKQVPVTKTIKELYDRYQIAGKERLTKEKLVAGIADEFEASQMLVFGMIDAVRQSLERLKVIALKPNPMSTIQYMDILIVRESTEAKPGFQERIMHYKEVKAKLEAMESISKGKFNPYQGYRARIQEEREKNPESTWALVEKWIPSWAE